MKSEMRTRTMFRRALNVRHLKFLTLAVGFGVVAMVIFLHRYQTLKLGNAEGEGPDGVQVYIHELENAVVNASFTGSGAPEVKKVRVLCLIITTEERLEKSAQIINVTWAQRCQRHFFVLKTVIQRPDIINTVFKETNEMLQHKVMYAVNYVYQNHILEFDWLLRTDDETYVITNNLQYLLSHYDSHEPGYLGFQFRMLPDSDFMSDIAAYAISNRGVRRLIEFGFNGPPLLHKPTEDDDPDDIEIATYMNISGVPALRAANISDNRSALFGSVPEYFFTWPKDELIERPGGPYSITFHYMEPEQMLLIDHLLYRTAIFGRTEEL